MDLNPFGHSTYMVHKQFFKLFGGTFRVYDPMGALALYADMKAFKLREDIRLYSGEDKLHEVLCIKSRHIIDISATYDVVDPATQERVGALRRRGLKSMIQDEWVILDNTDQEVGYIQEDSIVLALVRRFLTNLIPQNFHGYMRGVPVLKFSQNFNPFTLRLSLDFTADTGGYLDRRLGIAAAVLLCAIENRQQ
ncbi:MAG: hypothetical protein ABFD54_11270 [Armatimonadota bacterium]|nr:hypothetical protein [bacterium]